jgi:hypothetical protein
MIQDLLSTDRFRWSLAPSTFVESKNFFEVTWESRPPSECNLCDGIQGAVLHMAKFEEYPQTDAACEEQEVLPDCEKFLLIFYALRSRVPFFKECSYVGRVGTTLSTQIKECGGGGVTSVTTAKEQLQFWRSTADETRTIELFDFDIQPKVIPGDPALCEEPDPDEPEPPILDEPFPPSTQVFLVVKRVGATKWTSDSAPILSSNESEFRRSAPLATFDIDYGATVTQPARVENGCNFTAQSASAPVRLTNLTNSVASTSSSYSASWDVPPCGTGYQTIYNDVYLRFKLPGGRVRDFLLKSARPFLGPDNSGQPPPPPPPQQGRLYRHTVDVAYIELPDSSIVGPWALFRQRMKDTTVCSATRPEPYSLSEFGQFLSQFRVIEFTQDIEDLGPCEL